MEQGENLMENIKKLRIPHSLLIIIGAMVLACILTYLIPAGSYARIKVAGKTVVDPSTFHYVSQHPVNPLTIFNFIYPGMVKASKIIFALMCAGGGLGIVLDSQVLQGAAGSISQKVKGKEWVIVAGIMVMFAIICVPAGFNSWIPFSAVGLVIAKALGFDAIVGVSMIMLGGAVGFSCGAMNLSNTGTAQTIAELPIFSGLAYRLFCMIPFLIVTILYVVHYALKIKKDPTKSYVYGIDLGLEDLNLDHIPTFQKENIPGLITIILCILTMIYLGIQGRLDLQTCGTMFIYMGIFTGIACRINVK